MRLVWLARDTEDMYSCFASYNRPSTGTHLLALWLTGNSSRRKPISLATAGAYSMEVCLFLLISIDLSQAAKTKRNSSKKDWPSAPHEKHFHVY